MIERKIKKQKGLSLFLKVTIPTAIIVAVVVIVVASIMISSFSQLALEKEILLGHEAVNQLHSFIEEKYNRAYNLANYMHTSENIADYFTKILTDPERAYSPDTLRFIDNYLLSVSVDNDISEYILVTAENHVYATRTKDGRTVSPSFDFNDLKLVHQLLESDNSMQVVYDSETPYISKGATPAVSFMGKIFDPNEFPARKVVGIYIMNIPIDRFNENFNFASGELKGNLYLVNQDNQILFSSDKQAEGLDYARISQNEGAGSNTINEMGVGVSGLRVINTVSEKALYEEIRGSQLKMVVVLIIGISIITLVLFLFLRLYSSKIVYIARQMQGIGGDDFSARLPVVADDEIGMLSQSFNEMCEQIDKYIKLNYSAEMKLRTAELNSLQAQINPHFLFNTIESIRMKALEEGNPDIAQMLSKLGNIFRWSTRFNEKIVYLEDEIDYVSSYLELQSIRFNNSIEIDIQIEESLLGNGIPKLILQPVVENAIMHGLFSGTKDPAITINAVAEQADLVITVADSGGGMTKQDLYSLREKINSDEMDSSHSIGLKNVHDRIRLLFGKPYGIEIDSKYNHGTSVIIRIPDLKKEDMQKIV